MFASRTAQAGVVKQIKMNEDFSFLLDAYRPDYYYWECVDMLRKLTLIGLLVLVDRGSVAQICVAICISFFFFALHVKTWPYKAPEDNWLKASTEVALFITVLMAIVLRTDLQNEQVGEQFYDDLVVMSFVVLVPVALVIAIAVKINKYNDSVAEDATGFRLNAERGAFLRTDAAQVSDHSPCSKC